MVRPASTSRRASAPRRAAPRRRGDPAASTRRRRGRGACDPPTPGGRAARRREVCACLAEGDARGDERFGDVGRVEARIVGRGAHRPGVERRGLDAPGERREGDLDRVDRVEDHLLVLLQITVVPEREPVQDGRHRHEVAEHAARPSPARARRRRGSGSGASCSSLSSTRRSAVPIRAPDRRLPDAKRAARRVARTYPEGDGGRSLRRGELPEPRRGPARRRPVLLPRQGVGRARRAAGTTRGEPPPRLPRCRRRQDPRTPTGLRFRVAGIARFAARPIGP